MNPEISFLSPIEIARRLKDTLIEVSPMIEELTQRICPSCRDVCCKQKHAMPEERDLIFQKLLGIPQERLEGRAGEEPCQFLSNHGCIKPRWQRPF